ncbi:MAG: ABC transporter ATP-binding protein [Halieaceae bacterium]|nr:ABC transporter ATP-binding protein [Halieaceae bacterium]
MTIELRNVSFTHPDTTGMPLLDIPEWSVAAGQRLFVHGPSGSGKSTLLNLVSGLLECREGEVAVLGERLDRMSRRKRDRFRAHHVGYVFQRFNLIPYLSAIENIELARCFSESRRRQPGGSAIQSLLELLNVASDEWHKPTERLSMGQQQRVAIARALINRPELLIADEPTSSLDQDNRDAFLSVLMAIVNEHDMTLLFVSHDMSLAERFNQVQALSDISRAA